MTICACGTDVPTEAAAQRHAKVCSLQGYPRGWAERHPDELAAREARTTGDE